MRALRLILLGAALAVAGCSSDDAGTPEPAAAAGGPKGAAAFIRCFDKPSYEARKPKPREESVFAFQAKSKGYEVTPVNVHEEGILTPGAYLVFFASAGKAQAAMKELGATSVGDVKPTRRGPAVIGYVAEQDRRVFGAAVDRCLG